MYQEVACVCEEMRKKALSIIVLMVGLTLFSSNLSIQANPYWVPDSSVGSVWTNSTIVKMPCADVLIQIDYLGQSIFDIDFIGEYTIQSNETHECTLAYAFPNSWTEGFTCFNGDSLNITFDDNLVSTWPFDFENSSWIQAWGSNTLYHIGCDPQYVAFNVSVQADTNHTLRITTAYRKIADTLDYLSISYVCGTALSFMGGTKETITMVVANAVSLSYIGFSPLTNLTVTNEGESTIAVWNLVYPAEYLTVYDPVDAVYVNLEENEILATTSEISTSTTTEVTTSTTPEKLTGTTTLDIFGLIGVSGGIGLVFFVATIVLWKSRRM